MSFSVIILSGGKGTRMGSPLPKQFLPLAGKPVVLHSFDLFCAHPEVEEIIVVCSEEKRALFTHSSKTIKFAEPGKRRQDSSWNGLQHVSEESEFVMIHDAARPLISQELLDRLFTATRSEGAACVGMPLKFTIKKVDTQQKALETPKRQDYWEIQTPQAARTDWLLEGFAHARENELDVTDDMSLLELVGLPVQLVKGSYQNIKVTTPDDFYLVERILLGEQQLLQAAQS